MWRKFRKHKLALIGLVVTALIYLVALLAPFISTESPYATNSEYTYAPPQPLRLWDTSDGFDFGLYAYGYTSGVDMETFTRTFETDKSVKVPVGLFVKGDEYKLFGLITWDRHLIGAEDPNTQLFLLGTDRLGRDMFSRIIYGTRISMSIGLVGVALSLVLGVALGGISGYYGGWIDNGIQRLIEVIRAVPTIPLWMGLAAALPPGWSGVRVYLGITVILSLIGWTDLARVVRGRFLAMREEEFILAAKLDGTRQSRIIARHMVPSFLSHIIASVTLSIPALGRVVAGSAEHPDGRHRAVAVRARRRDRGCRAGAQLHG
jgi:peptide/nickel transport system permease protein